MICSTRARTGRAATRGLLFVVLLGSLSAALAAAPSDATAVLRELATAAQRRLAERVEPPAAEVTFLCLAERGRGAPLREYVLRQQAETVQALLDSAISHSARDQVQRLLAELARDGSSLSAVRWLVEQVPLQPARLRQAAALGELPAALAGRMHTCGETYFGLIGRTFKPLGELALADYQRVAELDSADPWNWLVLAWLAGRQGEPALARSLTAARTLATPDSLRAQIFAQQQRAWLRQQQGRSAEARAAAEEALRLAQQAAAGAASEVALRDLAQTGNALGAVLQEQGEKAAAREVLRTVATMQQRLTDQHPDDLPAQYALIDTLLRLYMVQDERPASAADSPLRQAMAIYEGLQRRTPLSPMVDPASGGPLTIVAAGLLTLLLGLLLLWRYRRRVAQLMMMAARLPTAAESIAATAGASVRRPSIELQVASPAPAASPVARLATVARRRAAAVQMAAALTFGLFAAILYLQAVDTEPNLFLTTLLIWTWAWPVVLALGLVWDGDQTRRRQVWAAYFLGLLLICILGALGDTPPLQVGSVPLPAFFQGLLFWATVLSVTPYLLLFLNRAVRSIGPALLAMMLTASVGGMLALAGASTPAGMRWLGHLVWALAAPLGFVLPTPWLLGMLAFAPLALWVGRRLRTAYAAKWLSDQSLMIDTLWLFQACVLSSTLYHHLGPAGWWGLAGFGLHKSITWAGMRPAARAARQRTPVRLLLLRVFGRRGSSERLFDLLGAHWRYVGPIHMIGAPDLAGSTIDPEEFLDFLAGRLRQRFIREPSELPARLAALDERCDFDARWRVSELFCGNDTWREAVQALMARSDVVAMDLRGFGPDNHGCIFELQSLLDLVPVQRVALLVDDSTDAGFLRSTMADCASRMPDRSSNARSPVSIALLDTSRGELAAVEHLLCRAQAM